MFKRSVLLGFLSVITGILATGLAGVLGLSQLAVGLGTIASLVAWAVVLRMEGWTIISLPSLFASFLRVLPHSSTPAILSKTRLRMRL